MTTLLDESPNSHGARRQRSVWARVWSTPTPRWTGRRERTWHFAVYNANHEVVLYDNTGDYQIVLRDALIRVDALRHMVIAGHTLPRYEGVVG